MGTLPSAIPALVGLWEVSRGELALTPNGVFVAGADGLEIVRRPCDDEVWNIPLRTSARGRVVAVDVSPRLRDGGVLRYELAMRRGPYVLRHRIGTGGMSEVWKADQEAPIRRTVALKLIKAGLDSREVLARFEAERQALALMDHPCIARAFDAGTTPHGRPFFVMEYVQGIPINEYCDRRRLNTRARLELFQKVCHAVGHAHQKSVVHRDLKPSNILVADVDAQPSPKVIDFGVAKATTRKLTEQTMATSIGQMIGTPEYMSPEQAELTNEDVDTRTDVYSLGVILYEIFVGASLRGRGTASRRTGRHAPYPARRGSAEAQHPAVRARRERFEDHAVASYGHPTSVRPGPRRPGLDRDACAREGSQSPLRFAGGTRTGHPTPPRRPTRPGRATDGRLSHGQVRAAPPRGSRDVDVRRARTRCLRRPRHGAGDGDRTRA